MKRLLLAGSGSNHLWRYCNMISDGFDEVIIVTNQRPKEILAKATKIVMVDFSLRNPIAFIRGVLKIRKQLKDLKPDFIHILQANTVATAVIRAAEKSGIPIILTALGSDILITPKRGLLYKLMIKFSLSKANIITSDSTYMAKVMGGISKDIGKKIIIANFGIGVIPDHQVVKENIIYSNRMHKDFYCIDKVIRMFCEFTMNKKQDWRLVVAGEGPETDALIRLSKMLGIYKKVDFVGFVDAEKNAGYYNRAKIYISIPDHDATSISLLEAMACGCIPIVSNLPANSEWIIDGTNGIIINEWDNHIIEKALTLDADFAININRKIINDKASIEVNKKKFMTAYVFERGK